MVEGELEPPEATVTHRWIETIGGPSMVAGLEQHVRVIPHLFFGPIETQHVCH